MDCGEGKAEYLELLETSIQDTHPEAYISDIIISHGHGDHWGGLTGILNSTKLNPHKNIKVHKFPVPFGCHLDHLDNFPKDIQVMDLTDNQIFKAQDVTLKVVYTPGHTKDHCTFWLDEEKSIFTADCILGQGTAVFEDLSEYIDGLSKLVTLKPEQLYPGHGPLIENGIEKIKEYIHHRLERENQIIQLFSRTKQSWTPMEIVEELYKDYPQSLHLPAARGIVLHLQKLQRDGKVDTPEKIAFSLENFSQILSSHWHWNIQKNSL